MFRRIAWLGIFALLSLTNRAHAASCTPEANGTIDPTIDCSPVAVCNGSTNDGPTFAAAMMVLNTLGGSLKVPAKTCLVNSTLNITNSHVSVQCAGADFSCTLLTSNPSMPQITATAPYPGVNYISVRGLVLWHNPSATQGGDGIDFTGWVESSDISDVVVLNGYNSIVLGPCSVSRAHNLKLLFATQDNLEMIPLAGANGNTLQWDLEDVAAGGAQRYGIYVWGQNATVEMGLGDWHNVQTYVNGAGSLYIATPRGKPQINNLRIDKGWFCCSTGGPYEVYVAAGGSTSALSQNNRIQNSTVESCTGYGIALDGYNSDFTISGSKVFNCHNSAILSFAQHLVVDGVILSGNGGDGIDVFGGTAVISGLSANGNHKYGISTQVDALYGSAGDLTGNTSGGLFSTVTLTNTKLCAFAGVSGYCR
jgi:hypothetical protein